MKPQRFKRPIFVKGDVTFDGPPMVRYSTIIGLLSKKGDEGAREAIRHLMESHEKYGNRCGVHGELPDPIVLFDKNDQIIWVCPECSDERLKALWEKEKPT